MPESNPYSTLTVNGSADEFPPSPTIITPKTLADKEADKAMAKEREHRFMADTSSPFFMVNTHGYKDNTVVAERKSVAAAAIEKFDGAFDGKKKKGENRGAGGSRQVRK